MALDSRPVLRDSRGGIEMAFPVTMYAELDDDQAEHFFGRQVTNLLTEFEAYEKERGLRRLENPRVVLRVEARHTTTDDSPVAVAPASRMIGSRRPPGGGL